MRSSLAAIGIALLLGGALVSMASAGVPRVIVGEEFGATW